VHDQAVRISAEDSECLSQILDPEQQQKYRGEKNRYRKKFEPIYKELSNF
jgi:hypothetical protein